MGTFFRLSQFCRRRALAATAHDHWTTALAAPDAPLCVAAGAAGAVVALVQL